MPTPKKAAPKKPAAKKSPPTVEKTVKQAVTSAARKSGPVAQVLAAAGIAAFDVAKTVKARPSTRRAAKKPAPRTK